MSQEETTAKTNCCPPFDPKPWDERTVEWKDKLFVKDKAWAFMHMPLNLGSVITRSWNKIDAAGAVPKDWLVLSYDPSPWTSEQYFAVTKEVPGMESVRLSGTYLTKVFEGPYSDAKKWVGEMMSYVESKGENLLKLYFFYTTCPKCAEVYGKNYVVAFAQIK